MKKVTIHSDGWGGEGTVILDGDGNKLLNVYEATIRLEANRPNEVDLVLLHTDINVQADITEVTFSCPVCGDQHEHKCNNTLGGGTWGGLPKIAPQCEYVLILQDPAYRGRCIRSKGHDMKHFDGDKSWSQ